MKNNLFSIFARYLIILITAIPTFYLYYTIFTPLTIYFSYTLFNLFFNTGVINNIILLGTHPNVIPIEIIKPCVAGAAYFLLFALNMSVPIKKPLIRIQLISFSFISLLFLNVLRIFFLGILAFNNSSFFDIFHAFFWYALSIVFVISIWFLEVYLFKIKEIPFYTDLKTLYNKSIFKKR